ncbi:MAG: hypothetical protein FJX62_24205 [Alphaproteobacteria bacterium]|nr:hypothetical protein [Alphaproteobacteria bacterium]
MDLGALFRRRPPRIADRAALAEFIDRNAAFLVQKGIYEYARARAGHFSKVMFGEAGFQEAVEISRWRAYPLGLAMVGELAEGMLRPAWGDDRIVQREAFLATVMSIFDRYPVPTVLGETVWAELRAELARRLHQVGLHAPKRAIDIPEIYAQEYFDLFPIHAKLRSAEFGTTRNYLRITMANIFDELEKRLDVAAVAGSPAAPPA